MALWEQLVDFFVVLFDFIAGFVMAVLNLVSEPGFWVVALATVVFVVGKRIFKR